MSAVETRPEYEVWIDVPWPEAWAAKGRCRTAPTNLFFPDRGGDPDLAKQVCAGCPVFNDCRAYAMTHPRIVGVWAGLTAKERHQLRRADVRIVPPPEPDATIRREKNKPGTLYRTLTDLASHPRRWARVAHFGAAHSAPAMASQLRNGHGVVPPGRWRFEGRVCGTGGSDLYAYLEELS